MQKTVFEFLLQTQDTGLIPVEVAMGRKDKSKITRVITRYKSEYGVVISNKTSEIKKKRGK